MKHTHTHLCIVHRRERYIYLQGEGEHVWGFIFVLLIHIYRGNFVGFSYPRGFPKINKCISCVCISLSDPAYDIVVN